MLSVWPVDNCPGSDVQSRDVVCRPSVAAGSTTELVPVSTIRAFEVPAERAPLARVSRVDENHGNSYQRGLVINKSPELEKSPVGFSCLLVLPLAYRSLVPLSASGRYPGHVLEVFKSDCPSGAFRLLNERLGNAVVCIALKPGLTARDLAQLPLCRPGAFLLKITAAVGVLAAVLFDLETAEGFAIAVEGDVHDPEIYSENIDRLHGSGFGDITRRDDVELAPLHLKIDLALSMGEELSLVIAADERDLDAAIDRPDGDHIVVAHPEDTVVEWLRGVGSECVLVLLVPLVARGDLGDAEKNNLRRQTRASANFVVDRFLDRSFSKDLVLPGVGADLATGGVGRSQRFQQGRLLLPGWLELYGSNQLHTHENITDDRCSQESATPPPPPEGRGNPARLEERP